MNINWGTVLGSMDDSLESQLAMRDMTNMNQILMGLSKEAEQRRQFEEGQKLEKLKHQENVEYRKSVQEDTRTQREKMEREREADNKRSLYGALTSGRRPGDRVSRGTLDKIAEFEPGTPDYAPDPNDPMTYVYKIKEAEMALAKAKADADAEAERRRFAAEDQKMQRERLELARKDEERKDKAEERAEKKFTQQTESHEKRMAKIASEANKLPPMLNTQFNKLTEDIMRENAGMFFGVGPEGEFAAREAAAAEALKRLQSKMPGVIPTPIVPPKPQGNDGYLSPEEVKRLFPQLPPGAKVRRVQ